MSATPKTADERLGLHQLTVTGAIDAIDRGDCSAEEIARACLERIAAREPTVQAWQWLEQGDEILARVRSADRASALRGLMFGVKDTIDTGDMPTEYGSVLYTGHRPSTDAAPVELLRKSGGVAAGKTVATEFAYFAPGKTVNPHDADRTPGGSSSGSAAAVADWMVPVALGSQTAGSVTRPAAFCGCVGYVASHGGLPTEGVRPLSPSLDSLGVLARSVEDVSLIRDILAGRPPTRQSLEQPRANVRLATTDSRATGSVDNDMLDALDSLSRALEAAGVLVEPLGLDPLLAELVSAHELIMAVEAGRELGWTTERPEEISPQLRELIVTGQSASPDVYRTAQERVASAGTRIAEVFESVDALLAPAAPGAAPHGPGTGSPHLSRPWQALGLPTVTLPAARNADGLPLGVQLIGARDRDDALLSVAAWVHRQLPGTTALPAGS